ncbi:hypothetical protein GPECTOR_32g490 [Gonium pectorale]|uniref:Uncharacterized protein n=1 Tax=Gonium pectorale TaxID=33097 RepID=A0A150GDF0_GONPE|nr:hypothetical protein GPECTOR_32g490 [Gonium pectorale]|eukprot:KXZ47877.1 hypothetical protein GPECTOR_32g490 [Gonium pectorale]
MQRGVHSLDQAEDVGYYFKYLGGIAFSARDAPLEAPGAVEVVAASSKHGLAFFSDLSGVYGLSTASLPSQLAKDVGGEGYAPPQPSDVCVWHQPRAGITHLALSADEEVLAAVDAAEGVLSFFPLAHLAAGGQASPHWTLSVGVGIRQFAWCKAAAAQQGSGPSDFLVVTAEGGLLLGRYGDASSLQGVATGGVLAADWCPREFGTGKDSPAFAYSTGSQLVIAAVRGAGLATQTVATLPLQHPDEPDARFESLRWVLSDSIVLGATLLGDGEGDDEYSCLLALSGWQAVAAAPPQGATLHTDNPGMVEADSTPALSGPYLHAVSLARWGAVVRAHRKASDDHVRLLVTAQGEFGGGDSGPQSVSITEDKLGIRLPNGPGGDNNYVLGLAIDTSTPMDPLPHPLSSEKPPLTPPPVLLVATSDGALRVYAFGHLDLQAPVRPGPDAVVPLPAQPPAWAVVSETADSGFAVDMADAAAKAALPDADDDNLDSDGGEEATSAPRAAMSAGFGPSGLQTAGSATAAMSTELDPPATVAAEDQAARVALPGDDDDDLLDADDEPQGGAAERRRASAAARLASDSESGEEVTSPGVYGLSTASLPSQLAKDVGGEGYAPPQPSDVCVWHQPRAGITHLALSADEEVLAAVDAAEGVLSFFPLAHLAAGGQASPHWTLSVGVGIRQFAWCKAAAAQQGSGPSVFLVVTAEGGLLLGRYGDASSLQGVATGGVLAADWCPREFGTGKDSPAFAYSTGSQLVIAAVRGAGLATQMLATLPLQHPSEPNARFESLRWVLSDSIVLGATPLGDGEGDDEYSCLLALSGWQAVAAAPPQGATLHTDNPGMVEADSTPALSGPYLHAVSLARWGAVVRAHRKASDDHVRLLVTAQGEFGGGDSGPQSVSITEDKMGIRLPNGPGGDNNYVLGLAIDTSTPMDPLPHPLSSEKPPLTPPPVLLVATSDGALRVYAFGHLDLQAPVRPGPDAVVPLPAQPPAWAVVSGAADAAREPERASVAAGDESDAESGEEVTSPAAGAPTAGGSAGLFAPPMQALKPPTATDSFIPASSFTGPKPGFVFTTRSGLTGYYKDTPPAAPAAAPAAAKAPAVAAVAAAPQPAAKTAAAVKPAVVVPPPRPPSPDVPAPKAQLASESKEGASAEASFLKDLHEARKMTAKMGAIIKDVAAGCPDAVGAVGGYKAVAAEVTALARRTAALRAQYERANKRVANLVDGLGALEGRLDALQLFSGAAGGALGGRAVPGGSAALATLEANLPLEPALEGLRRDVMTRLEALGGCLGELEDVLDSWEGPAGSALSSAASRILVLAAKLEESGACPMGLLKDPNGPLAALTAWCRNGGTGAPADKALLTSGAAAGGTPGATTPGGASAEPQWQTPRSTGGRRSPLLSAGATPGSPLQQTPASPQLAAVDAVLPQLQALARPGGKVRVTSAVRPPQQLEPPGHALLQLLAAAEAAGAAQPGGPEPSSPPRAQIKPTRMISLEAPQQPAAKMAAVHQPPAAFNFGALGGAGASVVPPTPSLTIKPAAAPAAPPAAAPVAAKPAAAPAATAAPAAAKPKASQPPIPSMAQMQAANKLQATVVPGASAAAKPAAPAAAPAAPAAPKPSGGGQPPVPTMALFAQAAQAHQKLAATQQAPPAARPTDSGSSAGSTATSKPPASKPPAAAQPPVPSLESTRAAAAAHARMQQSQQQKTAEAGTGAAAAAPTTAAPTAPAAAAATTAAPAAGGFGFGFGLTTGASAGSAPATGASTGASLFGALSAPASAPSGGGLFGALSTAPAAASSAAASAPAAAASIGAAAGGLSFGFGALGFGSSAAAPATSSAASVPSGSVPAGSGDGLFGAFGAGSSGSMFGAASAAASSAAPAAAPAAATAASAAASASAPAAGGFGVFGASATTSSPAASTGLSGAMGMFGSLGFGNAASSPASAAAGSSAAAAAPAATSSPFGAFGSPAPAATTPAPAAPSPFGTFASSAATAGASGFGAFGSAPASAPAASQSSAAAPTSSMFGTFGSSAPAPAAPSGPFGGAGGGMFGTSGGIQSKAAMPAVQAGMFSSFGQSSGFGSPAGAAAFGAPSTLGGGAAPAFGSAPTPPAPAAGAFGSPGFGAPTAFGSPAPVPPAAPASPFGAGFGQSNAFGSAATAGNAFSGFAQAATSSAALSGGGGFGAFSSAAPTPPAPAGGGFAAFAGQSGGFGGFGGGFGAAAQQPQQQTGGAFGGAAAPTGGGFSAFSTPAAGGGGAAADMWKPRK